MFTSEKTEEEVDELLDRVTDGSPTKYAGMSFEQGIEYVLRWLMDGEEGEHPLDGE